MFYSKNATNCGNTLINPKMWVIESMSFDQLLNSAKERNRAFFDKLGLPSS